MDTVGFLAVFYALAVCNSPNELWMFQTNVAWAIHAIKGTVNS